MKMFLLLPALVLLVATHSAVAGLQWETTTQEIKVHPLQGSVAVDFGFTNTGNTPVSILDLKSDCACISGMADLQTVEPGESGSVTVTFVLQGRFGPQKKGIKVVTDDHPATPVQLSISTTIPKIYEISPQRLVWGAGETHGPKSCHVIDMGKAPLPIEKAVSDHEEVTVELKTIREGFEYELVITPATNLKKTLVPIVIHPLKPNGFDSVRTYTVYARIW